LALTTSYISFFYFLTILLSADTLHNTACFGGYLTKYTSNLELQESHLHACTFAHYAAMLTTQQPTETVV